MSVIMLMNALLDSINNIFECRLPALCFRSAIILSIVVLSRNARITL